VDLSSLPTVFTETRKKAVAELLEEFPDPRLAAVRLSRVFQADTAQLWADSALFEGDGALPFLRSLCSVLSQSEFLTSILERDPDLLISFRSDEDFSRSSGRPVFEEELNRHLELLEPGEPFQKGLARFKLHEIFRIAVRDITNRASIEVLAKELSDVADIILEAAYEKAYSETLKSLGAPYLPEGRLAEMVILSMGKHGSRELNFSSDLDLIFVHEGTGDTDLDRRREAYRNWLERHPFARYLSNEEMKARTRTVDFERFFTELGTNLIEMLSEVGEYGSIYRIDMRLRPDGASGPLTRDLKGTLDYYETWGQKWERQALLRVRPTAGCPKLGQMFIDRISPFIFRKYVDDVEVTETLAEMRNLRARSISQAGSDISEISRNVKNGPGGIRDIEFMVQAVQILYGGQYPEFREGTLFEILRRIHQSGLLGENDFKVLSEGYNLLRRVEHRIQMDDLQRYHFPLPGPQLESLALSLGFESGALLEHTLFEDMRRIHSLFQGVFRVEEEREDASKILDLEALTPYWESKIKQAGLKDPASFLKSIKRLAEDSEAPHLNSKLKRLLKGLLPRLMKIMKTTSNPEEALQTFERISLATPARSTFFTLLNDAPRTFKTFLQLGSNSPYLADRVVTYPQLLNDIRGLSEDETRPDDLDFVGIYQDIEDRSIAGVLPRLRRFRTQMEIDIAGAFAVGNRTIEESVNHHSRLAEFCLERASQEVFEKNREILILAMGKFGGRELGFKSDLDCILIRPGGQKISDEIFHRAASLLVREMNVSTPDGYLYELDLRLRPYGKDGPLVPQLNKVEEYYRSVGQTWERLALTRARVVCGPDSLIEEFRSTVLSWVYREGLEPEEVEEIRRMRERIEKEKPKQILKAGPGGLLDVEFIAQTASLKWGKAHGIDSSNTCETLHRLAEKGLLPKSDV
ncbi:MAG: hypothetical protein KC994_19415, partial [Candidatus Omnitrophica bacterium]|nr:hypothetical protein [Candidatus Omnitrophota bacterium]